MKTVKVVWHWDDGKEDFLEWWVAKDSMTEEEAKDALMTSFIQHVCKHIVIKEIAFQTQGDKLLSKSD